MRKQRSFGTEFKRQVEYRSPALPEMQHFFRASILLEDIKTASRPIAKKAALEERIDQFDTALTCAIQNIQIVDSVRFHAEESNCGTDARSTKNCGEGLQVALFA
jgi:hypothetical protein